MANITQFSPLEDAFDELFRGFFVRPVAFEGSSIAAGQFRVDIVENDDAYSLYAELPGVKKEDINITINGDQVAISAEVKKEKDVKSDGRVLRSERHYGKVYRAFSLGQVIDEAAASAKYVDGVLELSLPKKSATGVKRIQVQ